MNSYYSYALSRRHDRRPIFEAVLKYLGDTEIKVLEIGTTRLTEPEGLDGDGGFSIYVCDHILKNGGTLHSFDLNKESIERAKVVLSDFINEIDIKLINDDALKYIDNSYDLIYLDGSSSNLEALVQLEAALDTNAIILCDDVGDKFVLASRVFPNFKLLQLNKTHQMAIYYPDRKHLINSKNTKEIDAQKHPTLVEEEYLKVDRTKNHLVIINAHIGSQIIINKYKDFQILSNTIIFYPRIDNKII